MVVVNKSYRIVSGLLAISWEDFRFVSFVRCRQKLTRSTKQGRNNDGGSDGKTNLT